MNKLLVNVYVPLLEQKFDIKLPINKKIGIVKKIIIETIYDLLNDSTISKKQYILYNADTGKPLDNEIYVKDSGIKNGTKLLLL